MVQWFQWLIDNWLLVATPVLVFLGSFVAGLWLRKVVNDAFSRWIAKTKWEGNQLVTETTRRPFLHWFLLLGAYIAIQVSLLPHGGKIIAGKVIGSLLVLSLIWTIMNLSEKLLRLYLAKVKAPQPPTTVVVNITKITVIVVGVLILLDIWGVPTTSLILVLATGLIIAALALRDTIPNLVSGAQIAWSQQVKVGDFIKVESGEAGYVTEVTWRNTEIKTLEGNFVLIPNSILTRSTVINYGRPLKRTTYPFRFCTRLHLKELTGLKAGSLPELINILKEAPDSVIYYHTHHFLEEHHYLIPGPANDFALWVSDALGNEVLGERLATIDTFDFPTMEALKKRLIDVMEDYLAKSPDGRKAPEGQEFHFIRSISAVLPTPYFAHDLREFVEVMKKITIDSIYYHVFEARLRLQKGTNDFSIWIEDCLEEPDLSDEIARLDPYIYTLEGLRSTIIQLVERRIK